MHIPYWKLHFPNASCASPEQVLIESEIIETRSSVTAGLMNVYVNLANVQLGTSTHRSKVTTQLL